MNIEVKLLGEGSERSARFAREDCSRSPNPLEAAFGADVYREKLLMNVSQCQYLDSTGVGWLLSCHKRFKEQGGQLVVHSASPVLMQILKLMRMELVLTMAENEEKARVVALGNAHVN